MSLILAKALKKLLTANPEPLAASLLTTAQRRALENFACKTKSVQAIRRGRGVAYCAQNVEVIQLHLSKLIPNQEVDNALPQRAKNIACSRSSKSGQSTHDVTYLLAKTFADPFWYQGEQVVTMLQQATKACGVCALAIGADKNQDLCTSNPIWLIENQALFDNLNWLAKNEPVTVIWYRGQLDNRLIDWLSLAQRTPIVYFFADYDGVGLNNYRRLKERLNARADFWLIPNWETLLARYGQNKLWLDTAREFEAFEQQAQRLLQQSAELSALVVAMKQQGLALEQEALWLNENTALTNTTKNHKVKPIKTND